jgi:hypothetical protein
VEEHVQHSYSQDLLDKKYMRFDHDLPEFITTVSLVSAIESILETFFQEKLFTKAPKYIIPDLREQVVRTIESINIYRSELQNEKQNLINYCLAMNFYLGCFELYKRNG